MSDLEFSHYQYGPYEQYIAVTVEDQGNRLPITIGCREGDPYAASSHSMTVADAERFHGKLGEAIKAAKKAGLE